MFTVATAFASKRSINVEAAYLLHYAKSTINVIIACGAIYNYLQGKSYAYHED